VGLIRLGFGAELVQSIGDLEPRSLEVDEDVTLRSDSRIVFEGPSRDANDLPIDYGTGAPHTVQNARRYPGGQLRTGAS